MIPKGSFTRSNLWLLTALLLVAGLACSQLPFLGGDVGEQAAERIATLEQELADARSTATGAVESPGAATEEADGAIAGTPEFRAEVETDFSDGADAFALGERASAEDDALLLGPYENCANDVGNFDNAVDCLVVCTACGDQVSEYRMSFDFTHEEGLTDREFGAILRLEDENGDHWIDRPDYLLALGFNLFDNRWRLYLHEPDQVEPWRQLAEGEAGFLRAGRLNHVEVVTLENGRKMEVYLNDGRILLLTGDEPEPGERLVQPWADSGEVGFLGLGRGVTARFDNFVFERVQR